ncbi:hypothetical protein G7Y89_g1552 [Cudoniella acicularis]|uniref:Ste24 endopeptidase n=1 Tax=Cudoniella acicularis TaxID=354080 RepID=A0A8H4W7S8_9HELO|nr:hypothetical protein G7Y89_g1552 [Cudoniella acicularis]
MYISRRQIAILNRTVPPKTPGSNKIAPSYLKPIYEHISALYRETFVIAIIVFNLMPRLWASCAWIQKPLEKLPFDEHGLEQITTSTFVTACSLIYHLLRYLDGLYRKHNLKEDLCLDPSRQGFFRRMALGDVIPASITITTLGALLYSSLDKEIDVKFVVVLQYIQLSFPIFYSILSQPSGKWMKVMEERKLRESLQDLAALASFPMKEVYVIDVPADSVHSAVQINGWPRKSYLTVRKDALEKYTTNDIVALFAQELGAWKQYHGLAPAAIGQIFFSHSTFILIMLMQNRKMYDAWGFKGEDAPVIGILIYSVIWAPPLASIYKRAAELGYSHDLRVVLSKTEIPMIEAGPMDWLYSMYQFSMPTVTARLAALEQLENDQDPMEKMEGAIRL